MTDQQLGLFEAAAAYRAQTRPSSFGLAKRITYAESNTLFTRTSGFMKAYKFTLNPYSGCGFGCEYCYARFFAPTEEARDSWGEWVKVKENAIELVWRAFKSDSPLSGIQDGDAIYLSSVTDPYQPVERKLGLTRDILQALLDAGREHGKSIRLTVQTRSPIATRDIDLFKQFPRIRVNFTISTDSDEVRLRYEPHCPSIELRLRAAAETRSAGVPIGISISPMLPIVDPLAFGTCLSELRASEYVVQPFKDPRNQFAAGTKLSAVEMARSDGWSTERYLQACAKLRSTLSGELLEGMAGYAPA